jgi:hypothetical protein
MTFEAKTSRAIDLGKHTRGYENEVIVEAFDHPQKYRTKSVSKVDDITYVTLEEL